MPYRFPPLRPFLRTHWAQISAFFSANQFFVALGAVTTLVILAAALVGSSALSRAADLREQERRMRATLQSLDGWIAGFVPPTPEEEEIWTRSEAIVGELRTHRATAAGLAALVNLRAEETGLTRLRISFADDEALADAPVLRSGSVLLEPISPALWVEFVGDPNALIDFLDTLPAHAEVRQIRLRRVPDGIAARALVVGYRLPDGS